MSNFTFSKIIKEVKIGTNKTYSSSMKKFKNYFTKNG